MRKLFTSEVAKKKRTNQSISKAVISTIKKLTKKELFSTICYLKLEQDFLYTLRDDSNPNFIVQVESKRISENLFADYPDNFFLRLMRKFDASVALRYERDIRCFLMQTCMKFSSMSYKVCSDYPESSYGSNAGFYERYKGI
jgi:hypothetical protein